MDDVPFISLLENIPRWSIGIICGLIPVVVSLGRKQWTLGFFLLALSIATGYFGGWILAAWVCLLFFFFALLSPSSGTGVFSVVTFAAIVAVVLYAVELRFSDFYLKLNLPSLVAIVGKPKGADPRLTSRMYRTFTAPDGRKMRARVEAFDGTHVTVLRKDGQRFTTTLDRFSEKDREFIRAFNDAANEDSP
ncbi:MAG: hypothetical protein MI807_17320 [Verrucomicrobiales bacterium]|nr:hypothetical protein [Verrucomicrobiales bacterium]